MSSAFPSPAAAEAAFYEAFATLDLQKMTGVWAQREDIYCIHPGGHPLTGARDVLQSWAEIFGSAHPPQITQRLIETHAASDVAIRLVEERIRPGGDRTEASIVMATNIYARGPSGWFLIAHHASLPLVKPRAPGKSGHLH